MKTGLCALLDITICDGPRSRNPWFDIQCEKGEIQTDGPLDGDCGVKVVSSIQPEGVVVKEGPQGWDAAYTREVFDFIKRCKPLPLPDVVSAELAVTDMKIAAALRESALTGEWVDL